MTAVAMPKEQAILVGTLMASFHKWAANHETWKKLYKKTPKDYAVIIETAFSEMQVISPASFDLWWVKEHMRFAKRRTANKIIYREEYKRNVRQLMYHYLCDYVRGKLADA